MNDEQKTLERLVTFSIEVAQNMLNEYETVIPFGVRAFADTDEVKMQCFQEQEPEADWDDLIQKTVSELKQQTADENIFAIAVVLSVESEDLQGIGLQIDTRKGPVLFVYPYQKKAEEWVIEEPIQAEMLIAPRVFD